MQELTIAVLLTQRIEPMLAHRCFRLDVEIRTLEVRALALSEMATDLVCTERNAVSRRGHNRGE